MPPKLRGSDTLSSSVTQQRDTDEETPVDDSSKIVTELKAFISGEIAPLQMGISSIRADIKDLNSSIQQITSDVANLSTRVDSIEPDILKMKIFDNEQEQRGRASSMRFFDVPAPSDMDSFETTSYVFTHIIKPALNHAVLDEVLASVPPVELVCEFGHFLGQAPPNQPPGAAPTSAKPRTIIVKFMSRHWKGIFCRYKQRAFDSYNRAHGAKAFAHDDLTKVNMDFLKKFKSHSRVEKLFYRGGMRLILKSDPTKTLRVHNPFSTTIEDSIIQP